MMNTRFVNLLTFSAYTFQKASTLPVGCWYKILGVLIYIKLCIFGIKSANVKTLL